MAGTRVSLPNLRAKRARDRKSEERKAWEISPMASDMDAGRGRGVVRKDQAMGRRGGGL